MGKNSKRKSGGGINGSTSQNKDRGRDVMEDNFVEEEEELQVSQPSMAPGKRRGCGETTLEEDFGTLKFEDPFEDEFEEEVVVDDDKEEGEEEDVDDTEKHGEKKIESWTPFSSKHKLSSDETLEIDESAYKMHHAITPEWPSLSFSFVRDTLGDSRTRFPHSLICAVGTQADEPDRNKLMLMKLSDLARTGHLKSSDVEDEMEKPYDEPDDDENNDEDTDQVEDEDMDPILEHVSMYHRGGVNRLRAMPQMPSIIASWSDVGNVYMYDVQSSLDTFQRSAGYHNSVNSTNKSKRNNTKDPFFTYQGHTIEGYAMDWSPVTAGLFATGDCSGSIHLWNPTFDFQNNRNNNNTPSTSSFQIIPAAYSSKQSVEDIQWSPTEATVLASAECKGNIQIYDTRRTKKAMLTHAATQNTGVDINVIAWNHNVSNLLASGADDGVFSVWDLRTFSSNSDSNSIQPLARFTCHQTPITSLEWHPTDESMILVSDDVGAYVYDLSIEADEEEDENEEQTANNKNNSDESIPPQLLFVHAGSNLVKEAHWHPQIPSLVMTTALSGFSVFVPSNL